MANALSAPVIWQDRTLSSLFVGRNCSQERLETDNFPLSQAARMPEPNAKERQANICSPLNAKRKVGLIGRQINPFSAIHTQSQNHPSPDKTIMRVKGIMQKADLHPQQTHPIPYQAHQNTAHMIKQNCVHTKNRRPEEMRPAELHPHERCKTAKITRHCTVCATTQVNHAKYCKQNVDT